MKRGKNISTSGSNKLETGLELVWKRKQRFFALFTKFANPRGEAFDQKGFQADGRWAQRNARDDLWSRLHEGPKVEQGKLLHHRGEADSWHPWAFASQGEDSGGAGWPLHEKLAPPFRPSQPVHVYGEDLNL